MSYMLIGGFDPNEKFGKIKEFLIKKAKNRHPKILYFPLASKNKKSIINRFLSEFDDCSVKTVDLLKKVNKKSLICDIIDSCILFFDGGDSRFLFDYLTNNNLEYIFYTAQKNNKIIAGVSAGAIIQSEFGLGDTDSFKDSNGHFYNFKMVKGLGLLDLTICPHFNLSDRDIFFDYVKNYNLSGLAISNSTAVYIDGSNLEVVKNVGSRPVYYFQKKDKTLISLRENVLYDRKDLL